MNGIITKIIDEFVHNLRIGNTILYPTDTIWGIGGDATSYHLIDKVALIKHRSLLTKKGFVTLMHPSFIEEYTRYSVADVLDKYNEVNYPLTLEIKEAKNLPINLNIDGFVALRIPFGCNYLMQVLEQFGKPIISTSANISGDPFPNSFDIIGESILLECDYIVPEILDNGTHKPSTIIGFDDNKLFRN